MTWGITSSCQAQPGARAVWEMSTEHTARGPTSPSKLSGALHIETRIRTPGLSEGQATKQVGIEHSGVRRGRQINFQWQVGLREQIEIFGFLWVTWGGGAKRNWVPKKKAQVLSQGMGGDGISHWRKPLFITWKLVTTVGSKAAGIAITTALASHLYAATVTIRRGTPQHGWAALEWLVSLEKIMQYFW